MDRNNVTGVKGTEGQKPSILALESKLRVPPQQPPPRGTVMSNPCSHCSPRLKHSFQL
jgi:hypothetical protein